MKSKYLISIVGPTAVGKTLLAIKVAKHFRTEIISSDSRQFFAEMNIGTAKPKRDELLEVKHHFIGNVSIHQQYSAGDFERDALKKLDELFINHQVVVMVGGSGLYVKAVTEGLDEMPRADPTLRTKLKKMFDEKGIEPLQQKLKELDPEKFVSMDIQNTQRVMRAIEMSIQGKSKMPKEKVQRIFETIKVGLNLPREILYHRIHQRVDEMMAEGLESEAKSFFPYKQLNALQTVGYSELFNFFEGRISYEKAVELIKQHTRNFAKRQLTWFGKEKEITWFGPDDLKGVIACVEEKM